MRANRGNHRRRRLARAALRGLRAVVCLAVLASAAGLSADEGRLETIRDDVRAVPGPSEPAPPARDERDSRDRDRNCHDDPSDDTTDGEGLWALGMLALAGVTSPFWGPVGALGDDYHVPGYFPRHPYDGGPGYMFIGLDQTDAAVDPTVTVDPSMTPEYLQSDPQASEKGLSPGGHAAESTAPRGPRRRWAGRLRLEYADTFHDLNRVGGHLLLETTSRFGLDMEANRFREWLPHCRRDQLWTGDANLVFRFAQSEHMLWRAGLGLNWLDDEQATDFGFNFTYGVDLFPARPWVLSAELDWGTLGSAELFHIRATAGMIVSYVEVYTGYEYRDIDRTQTGALIGGVRVWF